MKPGDTDKGYRWLDAITRNYTTANKSTMGGSSYNRSNLAVIHETLHLFGLSDRYSDVKTADNQYQSVPHNGFQNDIMGGGSLNINRIHYNNWGAYIMSQGQSKFTLNKMVDIDSRDGNLKGTAIK